MSAPPATDPEVAAQARALLEGGLPKLEELIGVLMSPDTALVQRGSAVLDEARRDSPDGVVRLLATSLRGSQHAEARSLGAVLLRRLLVAGDAPLWHHVSRDTQMAIKGELIDVLRDDATDRGVRKVAQDLVSEVAAGASDEATATTGWPELQPFLWGVLTGQTGSPPSAVLAASCLRVFAELSRLGIGPDAVQLAPLLVGVLGPGVTGPAADPDVRLAASEACASAICAAAGGPQARQTREALAPLAPHLLQSIQDALNRQDEDAAQDLLELLIEVADEEPRFFRRTLQSYADALLQVAAADQLEAPTRRLALEFLVCLGEQREKAPGMMRRLPGFLERFFNVALGFLADVEEDAVWDNPDATEAEREGAGEGELYDAGQEYLDRQAMSSGAAQIAPIAARALPPLLQSTEWQARQAGLIALAQVAEGCAKVMVGQVEALVTLVLPLHRDPHPRVRWAFCQALGQLCTDLGPALQMREHARIVPAFAALLADGSSARVQAHATAALVNFSEEVPGELLSPYLDALLPALLTLVQTGPRLVQEGALTAMASVADSAGEAFQRYYDQVVPLLSHVMTNATTKELRLLRAKALECVSLVGMAVGADVFRPHADGVMSFMRQLQESGLDADDPVHGYLQQAWTRICKCLGPEFLPHLGGVMPSLLTSAARKPRVRVLAEGEDDAVDGDEEVLDLGSKRIVLSTTEMEEMATACNLIYCYVDELKEGFAPWVGDTLPIVRELLVFYFHDEVRRSAVLSLPELLSSARVALEKGVVLHPSAEGQPRDAAWLGDQARGAWSELMLALSREPENDLRVDMLQAASRLLDIVAPGGVLLPLASLGGEQGVVPVLASVLDASDERRAERAGRRETEDFDEEEATLLEEEQEMEEEALDAAQELIGAVARGYGDVALAVLEPLLPRVARLLGHERTPEERRIALCVFCDLLEHCFGGGSGKYLPALTDALIEGCSSPHAPLRQAAAYALGLAAVRAPAEASPLVGRAAGPLASKLTEPTAKSDDNAAASDNSASAILCFLEHCGALSPPGFDAAFQAQVAAAVVGFLPLGSGDESEAKSGHMRLQGLIEASHPALVGDPAALPGLVRGLAEVVAAGERTSELSTLERSIVTLRQMRDALGAPAVDGAAASASAAGRAALACALGGGTPQLVSPRVARRHDFGFKSFLITTASNPALQLDRNRSIAGDTPSCCERDDLRDRSCPAAPSWEVRLASRRELLRE